MSKEDDFNTIERFNMRVTQINCCSLKQEFTGCVNNDDITIIM